MTSSLTDEEIQKIVEVVDSAGLSEFLGRYQLHQIEFMPTVVVDGRSVNGIYYPEDARVEVAITRDTRGWGLSRDDQDFYTLSQGGRSLLEAIQRTLIHEVGHHVHEVLRRQHPQLFLQTCLYPRSDGITPYARANAREYFAESFAAWVFARAELLIYDKIGYGMIETDLKALALKPKEIE